MPRRTMSGGNGERKTRGSTRSPSAGYYSSTKSSNSRLRRSCSSQNGRSQWRSRRSSAMRRSNSYSRYSRGDSVKHDNKNHGHYWKRRSRSTSWSSVRRRTSLHSSRMRDRHSSRSSSRRISHGRKRYEGSSGWRHRRRDEHESLSNLDRYKETLQTPVIVLRRVPSILTEDDIERAIRLTAISLGFSPPNFIKLLPVSDATLQDTTSAYVQFPSNDSAQVFYDACHKDFQVKNKRICLEVPEVPAARLALLSSLHSPQEWGAVIDSAKYPGCMGQEIPLPNLEEFVMDNKSGLLYNEKAGLFYDITNKQFISFNGVYYVRSMTSSNTLIPIRELSNPTHVGASTFLTSAKAKILNEATEIQEKKHGGGTNDLTEMTPVAPVDAAITKATAVASVLAAAQLAAKATQRVVKPKTAELQLQGVSEAEHHGEGEEGSRRLGGHKKSCEVLTIESVFGEATLEEELKNETPNESITEEEPDAKVASKPATTSSSHVNPEFQFVEQFICFVCIQQFRDAYHLSRHQTESLLHQKNCQLQGIQKIMTS